MVLAARRSTLVVAGAIGDTLVAPFLADKKWQSQGVLGDIGLFAVAADAAVGKSFLSQ